MASQVEDAPGRKLLVGAALFGFWLGGYFGVARWCDPTRAYRLGTPLDDAIPFVPISIWIYTCVYSAMLLPLFTVRCWQVFRRVALAYAAVILVSAVVFLLFPVTSLGFRPETSTLGESSFSLWVLKLTFFLDPPVNLFPSLHLSIVTLAALASGKVRRAYGGLALALTAAVAVCVLTVKQHYLVDAVAGLALGSAAYLAFVRRIAAHPTQAAYGWKGPLAYLAFHASAVGFVAALYRSGFRPWSH